VTALDEAYGQVFRRMAAGTEEIGEFSGDRVAMGARDGAHLFAGMDLPAREVLDMLGGLVGDMIEGRAETASKASLTTSDVRGLALVAFLLGWESRCES
jgi:hypothetical protein